MKVLALVAHADDELLGPGGALIRHAAEGDAVHVAYCVGKPNLAMYGHSRYGAAVLKKRLKQARKAGRMLGFKSVRCLGLKDETLLQDLNSTITALEAEVARVRPDTVYIHHGGDVNQDHRGVSQAGLVVLRGYLEPAVKRVLAFETASSTESAPREWAFRPNVFMDISRALGRKLDALKVYGDEMRPFPHPRSYEAIEALARARGAASGFAAAEGFELLRENLGEGR